MLRCFAVAALILASAGSSVAANARSSRTALSFQRDQAKRAYLNAQWARLYRSQQNDQQNYRASPTDPYASYWGAMQWRARQEWQSWQQRTAPRPVIRYRR